MYLIINIKTNLLFLPQLLKYPSYNSLGSYGGIYVSRIVCWPKWSPLLCFCTLNFTAPLPNNKNCRKSCSWRKRKTYSGFYENIIFWKEYSCQYIFGSKLHPKFNQLSQQFLWEKEGLQIFAFLSYYNQ